MGLPGGNLLIDTTPDLRGQLLRERVGRIHATVYTHDHADHVFGLDDLRIFPYYLGGPMPIYCEAHVEQRIRKSFDYAFAPEAKNYAGGVPQLVFHTITPGPFEVLGQPITALACCTGGSKCWAFASATWPTAPTPTRFRRKAGRCWTGSTCWFSTPCDPQPHATHFSLDEAVAVAERLAPKQTLLTHLSHDLEHAATAASLPPACRWPTTGCACR